jgi:hypothetical protein
MAKLGKYLCLCLVVMFTLSNLLLISSASAQWRTYPTVTPQRQFFTYNLANNLITYYIEKYSPSGGDNASGYNLVVEQNYPQFSIEVSFYEKDNLVTFIAPSNGYSTSRVCGDFYPTNITMIALTNETSTLNPTIASSPTVPEFPITASLVSVIAAVSLLLVIGKRKLTSKLYNLTNS